MPFRNAAASAHPALINQSAVAIALPLWDSHASAHPTFVQLCARTVVFCDVGVVVAGRLVHATQDFFVDVLANAVEIKRLANHARFALDTQWEDLDVDGA